MITLLVALLDEISHGRQPQLKREALAHLHRSALQMRSDLRRFQLQDNTFPEHRYLHGFRASLVGVLPAAGDGAILGVLEEREGVGEWCFCDDRVEAGGETLSGVRGKE